IDTSAVQHVQMSTLLPYTTLFRSMQNEDAKNEPQQITNESKHESETEKAWALRSNRPRRTCTITAAICRAAELDRPPKRAKPSGSGKKLADNSKASPKKQSDNECTSNAEPKSEKKKSSVNSSDVVTDKPSTSESTSASELKKNPDRVEELVVNCDPFSLINDASDNYSLLTK